MSILILKWSEEIGMGAKSKRENDSVTQGTHVQEVTHYI